MRPLPPMRALEAFVAVAQAGSLSAAAASLGMSLAALSRRLQQLEQEIGMPLLQRLARGTILSPAGERYFAAIGPALHAVRIVTDELRSSGVRPVVRVSTTSTFARSWLIPRLGAFEDVYPEIEVNVQQTTDYVSLDSGEFDVVIRLGDARRQVAGSVKLFDVTLFPVCVAALARGIREPGDLRRAQLLGPDHRPEFWPEWWSGMALDPEDLPSPREVDSDLLYETAATGIGVAIGVDPIVRPFLADGRLVRLFEADVRSSRIFTMLRRTSPEPARSVESFCDWLQEQASAASSSE